jgi:hypothetical protein
MVIQYPKDAEAASTLQIASMSGSLVQQEVAVSQELMTQESEPISSSLMTNRLTTDGEKEEFQKTAIDQPNPAEMDTLDAGDLDLSISDDDGPITLVVQAQVHREQSPLRKKKSVSFDLSNITIIPHSSNVEGKRA